MKKSIVSTATCLLTADLHGNKANYNSLKKIIQKEKISLVFFAGDLLPKEEGLWHPGHKTRTIEVQREFFKNFLIDYLRDLGKYSHIYAIFGNDDFRSNYDLTKNISQNVIFLNKEVVRLPIPEQELFIAGYSQVVLTPFLQKDWEQWDNIVGEISHKICKTEGYDSHDGKHYPISFTNNADGRPTIAADLTKLALKSNPKKTVYLMHETPFNTPLDQISPSNPYVKNGLLHVGSKALRLFIEKEQPFLTMHGHIHETFRESGKFLWKCGSSVSVTPSHDFKNQKLSYVTFDIESPASATRQTQDSLP
jgi:Icc-related predicted phosphoesterase